MVEIGGQTHPPPHWRPGMGGGEEKKVDQEGYRAYFLRRGKSLAFPTTPRRHTRIPTCGRRLVAVRCGRATHQIGVSEKTIPS